MIPYKLLYISALMMLVGGIIMIFTGNIPVGLLFVATAVLFTVTGVNNQKNHSSDNEDNENNIYHENQNK